MWIRLYFFLKNTFFLLFGEMRGKKQGLLFFCKSFSFYFFFAVLFYRWIWIFCVDRVEKKTHLQNTTILQSWSGNSTKEQLVSGPWVLVIIGMKNIYWYILNYFVFSVLTIIFSIAPEPHLIKIVTRQEKAKHSNSFS